MAKLHRDELQKFIELTSLKLNDAEQTALLNDLEQLLAYTDELQTVSLDGTMQPCVNSNQFREDVVVQQSSTPVLEQAPEREESYFVVPKIVDQDKEAA